MTARVKPAFVWSWLQPVRFHKFNPSRQHQRSMTTSFGTPRNDIPAEAKEAVRSHIRGSGLLLGGRVIAVILTALTQVLIVRRLSTSDYVAWAYAFSAVLLLQILTSFGFPEAVPRFVAIYHERQDYPRMFGTMLLSVGLIVLTGTLVIAAFFCFPDKLLALVHGQKNLSPYSPFSSSWCLSKGLTGY